MRVFIEVNTSTACRRCSSFNQIITRTGRVIFWCTKRITFLELDSKWMAIPTEDSSRNEKLLGSHSSIKNARVHTSLCISSWMFWLKLKQHKQDIGESLPLMRLINTCRLQMHCMQRTHEGDEMKTFENIHLNLVRTSLLLFASRERYGATFCVFGCEISYTVSLLTGASHVCRNTKVYLFQNCPVMLK